MTIRFSIDIIKRSHAVEIRDDMVDIWETCFHIKHYKIRTSKYGRYITRGGCVYLLDE